MGRQGMVNDSSPPIGCLPSHHLMLEDCSPRRTRAFQARAWIVVLGPGETSAF
jgi:hypothetical protein